MKKISPLFLLFISLACHAQSDSILQVGTASYYAQKFNGRRCSSGDLFCQDSLTAAHKTLKFGTRVRVVNLKNDSTVIVKINDRLPANSKRCIDLSKRAARQLNFVQQGLTKVRLELVRDSMWTPSPISRPRLNKEN